MESNNNQDNRTFGTNVRDEDVSRETTKNDIFQKRLKKKPQLDKVRQKGNITDDNPFDYNNPTLKELYRNFRSGGLTVVESGFNALYLWCYDNYYSSGVPIKDKYKNIYAHPSSWFKNTHHMWKHNKWSVAVKILEIVPTISSFAQKIKLRQMKAKDGLWKTFEYTSSARKAASWLAVLISLGGIIAALTGWSLTVNNHFKKTPALELYINGEYAGEVLSISDTENAKNSIEHTMSQSLGAAYTLDCDISYKATTIDKGAHLTPAGIGRAFSKVAHENMLSGYGLYAYDILVAVAEDRAWLEESINEILRLHLGDEIDSDDESIQRVAINNFDVVPGSYPKEYFNTYEEIRYIFSLPLSNGESQPMPLTTDTNEAPDHLNIIDRTPILAGGTSIGTSSDVESNGGTTTNEHQISIETVVTKTVTVPETIPFSTDYIFDETLAENKKKLQSPGKNGSKTAVYLIEYVGNNEVSRRLLSETITAEPINQIEIQGTRPLTDEERRTVSTGTYIYPNPGPISSKYSWRPWGSYYEFHKGIDIVDGDTLDIVASDGGVVIQARNKGDGYGRCVMIQHDDGTVTRYAHNSKIHVEEGIRVAQGQLIATMGRTGEATGVHVHFEILKNGVAVNPMEYLPPR